MNLILIASMQIPLMRCSHQEDSNGLWMLLFLGTENEDERLRNELDRWNIVLPVTAEKPDESLYTLGEALFYEKELSGTRNIACSTCHNPGFVAGDGLSLPIGVGGEGTGIHRVAVDDTPVVHRNAPEIHNRDATEWNSMFWDGRVYLDEQGQLHTPAGERTPSGFSGVLSAQAAFPLLSRTEMLGFADDGSDANELADMDAENRPDLVWDGIMERLRENEEYTILFEAAFPGESMKDMNITHVADAIAAYEGHFWNTLNAGEWTVSDFNRYLDGDNDALTTRAREGAFLFLGKAGCAKCHNGPLLTDQKYHNIAVPELGPGFGSGIPLDYGRYEVTGDEKDRFAFRTPPLREVEYTGPFMHNGAFTTLREVLNHHLDPVGSLRNYSTDSLKEYVKEYYNSDEEVIAYKLEHLSSDLTIGSDLSENEINLIIEFLKSLSSPTTLGLGTQAPESVPGGHTID